jgi:hypothetical protein
MFDALLAMRYATSFGTSVWAYVLVTFYGGVSEALALVPLCRVAFGRMPFDVRLDIISSAQTPPALP